MKRAVEALMRVTLFIFTIFMWVITFNQTFSYIQNIVIIVGGVFLVFPVVWLGRKMLDIRPTEEHTARVTTFVHFAVMILFGCAIVRAVATHQVWVGWRLPIPKGIGLILVVFTGLATLVTVGNLALKGFGAPFAIALTKKLTGDWLYAWTRNPMVLAVLALLMALGIWYQSALFVLWGLVLVTPAWLWFVIIYEEKELEIRFGASYQEYKSKTPMLFPRKPTS
jgi:protein-S-isoprenylcysteine O-methyltransferase Ste14